MVEIDSDFVPPLSQRVSTTQLDFSETESSLPHTFPYFRCLFKQQIIAAFMDDTLMGLLSYIKDFENAGIGIPRSNYITTIAVKKYFRGLGIGKALYVEALKNAGAFTTRTWSGDEAQIATLEKFGFKSFKIIENHRGKGIHTIYYIK